MLNRFHSSSVVRLSLFFFVALSLQLFGCAVVHRSSAIKQAPASESRPKLSLRTLAIPGVVLPETINPELLELDDRSFKDTSKELRALILALAWMEKSEEQSRSNTTASLTSALRAAQISLEALLPGGQCQDSTSLECDNLSDINRRATHQIITTLQARSWTPPSMAPGRYYFSKASNRNITLLRNWETIIPTTPEQLHIDRLGFGVPFYGCRPFKKHSRICSPLSAVLSFLGPLSSDSIEAELSIVDTYQQEVLSIADTHIPLAANFVDPIKELSTDAMQSSLTLRCLSAPTSSTGVLLLLQHSNTPRNDLETFLQSVALNPSVRDSYTPCLASISNTLSIQVTAKLSKRITRALQSLLRDTFSTKVSRLAIINLTHETIPLSTLLTSSLSNANPQVLEIVSIGLPVYTPTQKHQYDALEDTAQRSSVKLFSLQKTCDLRCEDALNTQHSYSGVVSHRDDTPQLGREKAFPNGSFTVSPAM